MYKCFLLLFLGFRTFLLCEICYFKKCQKVVTNFVNFHFLETFSLHTHCTVNLFHGVTFKRGGGLFYK